MDERKNIQNHLASIFYDLIFSATNNKCNIFFFILESTSRPINNLVMNQSETARKYTEIKTLIDRTLPLIEHGKGC